MNSAAGGGGGHGSDVVRTVDQLLNGSHGSWYIANDLLSALLGIQTFWSQVHCSNHCIVTPINDAHYNTGWFALNSITRTSRRRSRLPRNFPETSRRLLLFLGSFGEVRVMEFNSVNTTKVEQSTLFSTMSQHPPGPQTAAAVAVRGFLTWPSS